MQRPNSMPMFKFNRKRIIFCKTKPEHNKTIYNQPKSKQDSDTIATHWKNCELLKLFATWQPQEHWQLETIHCETVQALAHWTPIIFSYQDSMSFIPCNKLKINKHTVINYSEELYT